MEYYSTIEGRNTASFGTKWMQLETTMLIKISLSPKISYHVFSLINGNSYRNIFKSPLYIRVKLKSHGLIVYDLCL